MQPAGSRPRRFLMSPRLGAAMSRFPPLLATLLAALLVPAALANPNAGVVRQGETNVHAFDNTPRDGTACVDLVTTWTVTLAYAPPTDVLTLSAGGKTATGSGGVARVSFASGVCTAFTIQVTGASVAAAAAYSVAASSFVGGSPVAWDAA